MIGDECGAWPLWSPPIRWDKLSTDEQELELRAIGFVAEARRRLGIPAGIPWPGGFHPESWAEMTFVCKVTELDRIVSAEQEERLRSHSASNVVNLAAWRGKLTSHTRC